MNCERCGKKLSRKTARLINGKVLCSTCMFAPSKAFISLTRNPSLEPPERFEPTVKQPGDLVI